MSEKEEGKELVKLDPQNISSTKEEVRVNYFNNLRGLVDYGNGQLTPEQINRVKNTVKYLRAGFQAAMPITCTGKDHCPNVDFCPLVKIESETGNPNVMPVGKRCLAEDSRISLSNGMTIPIKDIKMGDRVLSIDSDLRLISGFVNNVILTQKNAEIFSILTMHGNIIKCTKDHLFLSLRGAIHNRKPGSPRYEITLPEDLDKEWISIEAGLKPGDKIAVPIATNNFGEYKNPDGFAKLLGYFITDGSCSKEQTDFTNTKKEYIDEYIDLCLKLGGTISVHERPAHFSGGSHHKISWSVNTKPPSRKSHFDVIKEMYRKSGLVGIIGIRKKIPDQIMLAIKADVVDFINRFWAGDGCVSVNRKNKKISLIAVGESLDLFRQLQVLFWKIGVHSRITVVRNKIGNYQISISDKVSVKNFFDNVGLIYGKEKKSEEAINLLSEIKTKYTYTENDILWDYVYKITPLGMQDVYDLEVLESHNFIAEGIVVHNCPIEGELLATWAQDYCEALKLTEDDIFDLTLVKELAELDLQELRISNYLSKSNKAVGVGENVVGLDPDTGAPIMVEQISPAMELKLKIKDRRNRILESLVQTRKEKYKRDAALKQPPADDASSSLAAMKSLLEAAMVKRQSKITNLVQDQDGVYKPEPTTPTK